VWSGWWLVDGLRCLALRHEEYGHWCGYVGVPRGHAVWGLAYDDLRSATMGWYGPSVHGGVTWASPRTDPIGWGPGDWWWFGFDCGHGDDVQPGRDHLLATHLPPEFGAVRRRLRAWGTYRDLAYVQEECRELARQLGEVTVRPHLRRLDGRRSAIGSMERVSDHAGLAMVPCRMTRRKARRVRVAINAALRVYGGSSSRLGGFCRQWGMGDAGPIGVYVRQWAAEYRHRVMSTRLRLDLEAEKRLIEAAATGEQIR